MIIENEQEKQELLALLELSAKNNGLDVARAAIKYTDRVKAVNTEEKSNGITER